MNTRHPDTRKYSRNKGTLNLELELLSEPSEAVLFITVHNTVTKDIYILKIDMLDISSNPTLNKLFRNATEIFEEITRGFEQLEITDNGDTSNIIFEVALGSFRKEKIQLLARKRESPEPALAISQQSTKQLYDKVRVQRDYQKDYNLFKENMVEVCSKIANSDLAKKINSTEKWDKNKLKNMFITFSNSILRNLKKNIIYEDPGVSKKSHVQYRPENKLLIQRNQLLHNILKKAAENTEKLQIPNLDLNFDLPIPKNIVVIDQEGKESTLSENLPTINEEEVKKRIEYFEKRQQKLMEAENRINLIREQRLQEVQKWLTLTAVKQTKLLIQAPHPRDLSPLRFQQF